MLDVWEVKICWERVLQYELRSNVVIGFFPKNTGVFFAFIFTLAEVGLSFNLLTLMKFMISC